MPKSWQRASLMIAFLELFRISFQIYHPFGTWEEHAIKTLPFSYGSFGNYRLSTMFLICLTGSNWWTHVSSPVTLLANCLILNLGNIFSNCLAVYTRTCTCFGHLSIYAKSIWQKYFILLKFASKWNTIAAAKCKQLWQYHKLCVYDYCQLFSWVLIHLPCLLQSQVGHILLHPWHTLCQSDIYFSNYEFFLKIPYQTHKPPPLQCSKN